MSSPVAPSAPKRRWLSCFTAAHEGAPGKAGCLMVFAAGSSNFNGLYAPSLRDRARSFHVGHVDQVSSYRKVDGTETLTHFNGWWLFSQNGSGTSYYGAKADRSTPPPDGGWHAKQGLNPAPRVQLFDSIEEVPMPLRVPGALERHAVEVFGAGSEDCNGIYQICGIRSGRACYRRDRGLQTILWHRGWWLMNENGCGGSRYGFRCQESPALIPEDSIWAHKLGQSPAPGVVAVGNRSSSDKAVAVEVSVEPVGESTADAHTEQLEENHSQEDNSTDHPEPMGEPSPCASCLHAGSRETALRDAGWHEANLHAAGLCEAGLHEALQGQVQKPLSVGCSTSDSRTPSEVPEANPEFGNAEIDFDESVPTNHVGVSQPQALKGQESDDPVPDAADAVLATTMPDSLGAVFEIPESVLLTTPLALEAEACTPPTDVLADEASSTAAEVRRAVPYMAEAEAEDLPVKGFVSQRVKAFVSLSSGKATSLSAMGRESMPDRGMVSERIQAHQRFISKATTSPM